MEDGLVHGNGKIVGDQAEGVLILVVMEDGLVRSNGTALLQKSCCLNPCCNGRWSRTTIGDRILLCIMCLNPCCNGRWSRTLSF